MLLTIPVKVVSEFAGIVISWVVIAEPPEVLSLKLNVLLRSRYVYVKSGFSAGINRALTSSISTTSTLAETASKFVNVKFCSPKVRLNISFEITPTLNIPSINAIISVLEPSFKNIQFVVFYLN